MTILNTKHMKYEVDEMIKKILLLSLLGVSLTGCVVAPFDDGTYYPNNHGYDRPHSNNHGKPPSHGHKPPQHNQGKPGHKPPSHSQGKPPSHGRPPSHSKGKPSQNHKPKGNNHGGHHNSKQKRK